MPKARASHDIVLKKMDGTSKVGVSLWRGSSALTGGYRKEIVPVSGPRLVGGSQASYDELSPERGLVYSQQSFHRGLGQALVVRRGEDDFRYATSNDTLALFENSVVSGYWKDEIGIILNNPGFEVKSALEEDFDDDFDGQWGTSNATVTRIEPTDGNPLALVHSGARCVNVTATASNGYLHQKIVFDPGGLGDSVGWTGQTIKVQAWVKRFLGAGQIQIKCVGDDSGATSGQSANSSNWTSISVEKTIGASDTEFDIQLVISASGTQFYIDDVSVILPGSSANERINFKPQSAVLNSSLYVLCGRAVLVFNTSNSTFDAVYIDPSYEVETIREYQSKLYIGFGSNQSYKTSSDGLTWSNPTTATGNGSKADFFAVARNANGDEALFKVRDNQVSVTTDPSDTANWGAEIPVGSSDKEVTSFIEGNDSVYVGKEDGVYAYDRLNSQFRNLAPAAALFTSTHNFERMIERAGDIYAGISGQAFWRVTDNGPGAPSQWTELSQLIKANAYEGFSGSVSALTQDMNNLWVGLSASDSQARVITLRRDRSALTAQGDLVAHTVTTVPVDQLQNLIRFNTIASATLLSTESSSLLVFGRVANDTQTNLEPRVYRLRLPVDDENPARAESSVVMLSGVFTTQWIDFFYPDTEKALVKVVVQSTGLSGDGISQYIEVSYKIDDDGPSDDSGWTLIDKASDSPTDTVAADLDPAITFRRIRLRFRLATIQSDEPVELNGFTLHAIFNPTESNKWTVQTLLSDRVKRRGNLRAKYKSGLSATERSTLDTMRKLPFVLLEDIDGTEYTVKIRQVHDDYFDTLVNKTGGAGPRKTLATEIEMIEVITS